MVADATCNAPALLAWLEAEVKAPLLEIDAKLEERLGHLQQELDSLGQLLRHRHGHHHLHGDHHLHGEAEDISLRGDVRHPDGLRSLNLGFRESRGLSGIEKVQVRSAYALEAGDRLGTETFAQPEMKELLRTLSSPDVNAGPGNGYAHEDHARGMMNPDSELRLAFDLCSLVVLFYDLFTLPIFLVWDFPGSWQELISWCVLAFWMSDIVFSFRTGIYSDGHLIMRPAEVACIYAKGGLVPDALIVTIDLIIMLTMGCATGATCTTRLSRFIKAIRLVRLLRQPRLVKTYNKMRERYLGDGHHIVFMEVLKLIGFILWGCHTSACAWLFIGYWVPSETGTHWVDMVPELHYDSGMRGFQYITSFNWAVCQMVGGAVNVHPTNTAERLWATICRMIGFLFLSCVVSGLAAKLTRVNFQHAEVIEKMRTLRAFLFQIHAEQALSCRVCKQAEARLTGKRVLGMSDITAIEALSSPLRSELHYRISSRSVVRHPMLNVAHHIHSPLVREMCINNVSFLSLSSEESLFFPKEDAKRSYYTSLGSLVYSLDAATSNEAQISDETVRVAIEENQWVSEAALWCNWTHVGQAQCARKLCEVMMIDADGYSQTLIQHELIGKGLAAYAQAFRTHLVSCLENDTGFNDLTFTDFSKIVVSLPSSLQVVVGMNAVSELHKKSSGPWFQAFVVGTKSLSPGEREIKQLQEEVNDGKAILYVNQDHEVERLVSVVALRLLHTDGDRILVLLAETTQGGPAPVCKLPAMKCSKGQGPIESLHKLLHTRLDMQSECCRLEGPIEEEVSIAKSHKYYIKTRYMKTVYRAALLETWRPLFRAVSTTELFLNVEGPTPIDIVEVKGDDGVRLYAWLTPSEFEQLKDMSVEEQRYALSALFDNPEVGSGSWDETLHI